MIISPRITSPHHSDFSSLPALLHSPRFAGKSGQDLAIAIWEFLVDKTEGIYHFWPAQERLTGNSVFDPMKLLNCFGWAICGVNANLLTVLYKQAGFDARIASLKGHVVEEVFYDGGWHLFDGDLQCFHRKHPPHQDEIASYAECIADPTLISNQPNPSRPYYLPDRSAESMAKLYDVTPATGPPFDVQAHTMDFVLRPGERLERNTFSEGKWICFPDFLESSKRYSREWRKTGPWERFEPHRQFGNGKWVYEPKLTAEYLDFRAGVLETKGLSPADEGLIATRQGEASCVFDFDSPYVFAGTPARNERRPPADGCILEAAVRVADAASAARIQMAVSPDLPWFTVWSSRGKGRHDVRLDLTRHVVNACRYLLRFEFDAAERGSCGLASLRVTSSIMVNPASLGRLIEGSNPLSVRFGDDRGLPTRRWTVETNFADEQDVRSKTWRLTNVRFDPGTEDRIGPDDPDKDYEITFKMTAPAHGLLQRVYAFGSFRGRSSEEPTADRVAAYLSETARGPWRRMFDSPVLPDRNRWHFSAQGEADLKRPVRSAYVRFVGKAGMNDAKVRAHWLDDRVERIRPDLSVTHIWEEASGCCKRHTQRVTSADGPQEYEVVCGTDPALRTLILEADSVHK